MIKSSSKGISLEKFKRVLNLSKNYTFGPRVASAFFQPNSKREQRFEKTKKKEQPGYLISRLPPFQ